MSEYIKRTDAICAIKKYQTANCPEYKRDWVTRLTISVSSDIEKDIIEIPAADVVPVVRCKDCKHWNKDALACDTLPWVNSSEHANWYAEDFCSYGERRADNG